MTGVRLARNESLLGTQLNVLKLPNDQTNESQGPANKKKPTAYVPRPDDRQQVTLREYYITPRVEEKRHRSKGR